MAFDKENLIDLDIIESLKELGSSDDKSFLSELLELYLSESKKILSKIEDGLASENSDSISSDVHTFKGASSNIGAVELCKLCLEMEKKAKAGDLNGAKEFFTEIKDCYKYTVEKVKTLI